MKIGHIIVPAGSMSAQIDFYVGLGLTVRFRDGDRYAALSDGKVTVGLADASQQPVPGRVVLSIQVDGLPADAVVETGPHERRTVVFDPGGNPVVLYESL